MKMIVTKSRWWNRLAWVSFVGVWWVLFIVSVRWLLRQFGGGE